MIKLVKREREQISVFTSAISKERWTFVFNQENKYNDLGLRLAEIKRIALDNWISEGNAHALNSSLATIEKMSDQYPEPCYADVSFDVPEEYEDKFAEENYTSDQMYEFLDAKLVKHISQDGFIATSRVGDFALNRRLKDALQSLRGGHAVSGNLGHWLFDIQCAEEASVRTESDDIEWSPWGKSRLNDSQKDVVRKMLDAPEVFLCQGPPGTGKTTVIAEAVYQFSLRKKRILIASQTNLAVNNALSKLLGYPGIRAIRLGGAGKIDGSVEHITEENILRTFYENVKAHIQQRYFQRWNEIDASLAEPKNDQIVAHKALGQKRAVLEKYMAIITSLRHVAGQIEEYNEYYDQEDSESDLRYLQLAIIILSCANVKENVKIGVEDCVTLLLNLAEPITEAQKRGYLVVSDDMGNAGLSELSRRKKNEVVNNALKLFAAISAYCYSSISDNSAEISFALKPRKITNRTSTFTFSEDLVGFPPENYGMNAAVMNRIAAEIGNAALDAVVCTVNYMLDKQENVIQENEIENVEKAIDLHKMCKDIFAEFKQVQKEMVKCQNPLEALAVKYNCSIDELENTIKTTIETIEQKNHEDEAERDNYAVFFHDLIDHIDMLSDENQYKLENDRYQAAFINACNVVGVSCTEKTKTLTDKGFDKFDVVIIDEVSKATPPEMLIPLLIAEKAILVGDHRQLPPLFNEHYASNKEQITDENYERFEGLVTNSLFKRHYERAATGNKGALLVQYRMHREIMKVVNPFYSDLLTSGWSVEAEANEKKHFANIYNSRGSIPLIVPDHHAYWIDSSEIYGIPVYEKQEGSSKVNDLEIALISNLVQQIDNSYAAQEIEKIDVGVISFYGRQVRHLHEAVSKLHLKCVRCDVNTVDRFQGKEKPIVIVSLVRNVEPGKPYDASYVQAYQRMNVAFSRAQNLLIIVGARTMYTQQDITIENMETGEKLPPRKVYKDIVEQLEMSGCRFTADEFRGSNFDDTIFKKH